MMVLKTMRRAFTHMNDSRAALKGTTGVAASAARLPGGEYIKPVNLSGRSQKNRKSGAKWCILVHFDARNIRQNVQKS